MYVASYGLSGGPFQLKLDSAFCFESVAHRRTHAHLAQAVRQQSEGFLMLTGEAGVGKSTLLNALLAELDPKKVLAARWPDARVNGADLLESIARTFGLPIKSDNQAHLLGQIEAFLAELASIGRRALLVIEEAQNLTPKALVGLRVLSHIQPHRRVALQCILVGRPELHDLIQGPLMQTLRQDIIVFDHLSPLQETETRSYLEQRLALVGWKGDPGFDSSAVALLHRATKGIPRRINSLCNRLLLSAHIARKHRIVAADVQEAAMELREELGAEALPGDLGDTRVVPAAAGTFRGANPSRSFIVSSITARLDRLERAVDTLMELVRDRPPAPNPRPMVDPKGTRLP